MAKARETEKERLSRKLAELLEELRVALPGVQVLFAFLLTLPFTSRFAKVTALQRGVYFAAFASAALASVWLIAPSAYHRMRWRFTDKERMEEKRRMLITAGREAVVGISLLGIAMTATVFLVTDVIFSSAAAAAVAGLIAAAAGWLWFGIPLRRRIADPSQEPNGDD